jgi:pimeloyl-ACP methyl ester carboxylesterase
MIIFFILVCVIGILVLPYWIIPANPFPQPSGQWQVGTSDLIWDVPNQLGVIAKMWYPTHANKGDRNPYVENIDRTLSILTTGINPLYKCVFNKLYLARVQTPAFINATPGQCPDGFPVVLFSPGFGSINFLNTFYALEFASHGFIVIGINHPGSSASTILADGSQVGFNKIKEEVLNDSELYDQFSSELMVRQANNISMVLDKVINLNSVADSFLYQRINLSKIFAAGHSIGGAASFTACGKDQRISKAVNLDGGFINTTNTNYAYKELLQINSDREKYKPKNKTSRNRYDLFAIKAKIQMEKLSAKANLHKLSFESANHFNFTDLSLILMPRIGKIIGLVGNTDGLDLLSKTSVVMIEFFNK